MTTPQYLMHLQVAIKKTFGNESKHVETLRVFESFAGKVVFDGEVEVFTITGHPSAKRCYAWAKDHETGSDSFVVLERPPITDALSAVRAVLATIVKRANQN